MLLGFHPAIYIEYEWEPMIEKITGVANEFIKTNKYREHVLYEDGASVVAEIPGGGWISKSGPSEDFFVMGGLPETEDLQQRFQTALPELTFTPATICYSSRDVPRHRDSIKNGQASLVYPLHKTDAVGVVYDPSDRQDFYYTGKNMLPTIINITQYHRVFNDKPRIWFSTHFHESIDVVRQVFVHKQHVRI